MSATAMLGAYGATGMSPLAGAVGGANRDSCPTLTEASPGFRGYLPDCRAYEMVSPPFMGGFALALNSLPQRRIGLDAERFPFNSFGTFADTPSSTDNPGLQTLYLASRSADGWRTSSMMPPVDFDASGPSTNVGTRAIALPSADNSTVAWRMRDTSESGAKTSLFLRQGDGSFELVGPVTPLAEPTPVSGELAPLLGEYAAADLSRIPLRATLPSTGVDPWLWPGDTSLKNANTLYEYDLSEPGIGSVAAEPKLVGVKNEGRLLKNTEAQLISQCGILLGGGGSLTAANRIDRAVSDDGKYIFFTAQKKAIGTGATQCPGPTPVQPVSSEIYARIDGEKTVAISNPSEADCAACLKGAAKTAAETAVANLQAQFQGASADGTKVFFTSFQELFEKVKASGTTPNLYRFDFEAPAGEKLELVSKVTEGSAEVTTPPAKYTGFSADGESAYFIAKKILALNESQAIDPITELPQKAEAGKFNLYVWEAPKGGGGASTAFVAQLPAGNLNPVATPDGRFIVFSSTARLVKSNKSTVDQLFEYDAESGALVRVSVGDQGFNDNGNTAVNPPTSPLVSGDGRRVFFMSSNALTPGALNDPTNLYKNIYEWTWTGSEPKEAEARVFLILSAPANTSDGAISSNLVGIDADGENVYFTTTRQLVPQHTSRLRALYTARVEGGFPGPAGEPGCEADACQGLPAVSPAGLPLASAFLRGPGNAVARRKARRPCPRGGKRNRRKTGVRARCAVAKTQHRRMDNTDRGVGR